MFQIQIRRSISAATKVVCVVFAACLSLAGYAQDPYGEPLPSAFIGSSQNILSPAYQIEQGALDARSEVVTYRKADHAMAQTRDSSVNYQDLTLGKWSVRYFADTTIALMEQGVMNLSLNPMDSVQLPQPWALDGRSKAVWAPEKGVEWADAGTVALYGRRFVVPFDYMDKTLYIRVGGSSSKTRLFVNGRAVGFATDSRTAAEYNITAFVERGVNTIDLMVEGSSHGSRLECQEDWRLGGVNRKVELLVQPKIRIYDFLNTTTLDPTYKNGMLQASLMLKTELLNTHTVTVYYDLYNPQGELVNTEFRDVTVGMRTVDTVRFLSSVRGVELWTAETPSLYTILYRIKREGRWSEYASVKVGFREVKTEKGQLLLNGQKLMIKGVMVSEHNYLMGNVMTRPQIRSMIHGMKLSGINAVQGNGYPLPEAFYDLADSMGLYVFDVANVSAQRLAPSSSLANDPHWGQAMWQRLLATYERGKNHPSILVWCMGQDSGNGFNMYENYLKLKAIERYRPVQYSGAGGQWNSDLVCPVGVRVAELLSVKSTKPRIPSEVAFDEQYWRSPALQGAFLYRYDNACMVTPSARKVQFAALEKSGTLRPLKDGNVKSPSYQSHALLHNMEMELIGAKPATLRVSNHCQFKDNFSLAYKLTKNGKPVTSGTVNLKLAPGGTTQVVLPKNVNIIKSGYGLEVTVGDLYYFYHGQ